MKPQRATDREILESLMDLSDAASAERVRHAVLSDMRCAEGYARWSEFLPLLEPERESARKMADRVVQGVMERLAEAAPAGTALRPPSRMAWLRDSRFAVATVATAMAACLIGVLGWFHSRPIIIESVSGTAMQVRSARRGEVSSPLSAGDRLSYPAQFHVPGEEMRVRLANGTRMVLGAGVEMGIHNEVEVSQLYGNVFYQTAPAPGSNPFTVRTPHGNIVDIGTDFEVTMPDEGPALVQVHKGAVRLEPSNYMALIANEGERGLFHGDGAVIEPIQPASPPAEETRSDDALTSRTVTVRFRPKKATLSFDSPMVGLLQPQEVRMRPGMIPPNVRRQPPLTSRSAAFGLIHIPLVGRDFVSVIIADQKLDGKHRIYFDANGNGDMNDDPIFTEGTDFTPGRFFNAGEIVSGQPLWMRWSQDNSVPPLSRIEFVNPTYLYTVVAIPEPIAGDPAIIASQPYRFMLFDSNANNDYTDPSGSFVAWGKAEGDPALPSMSSVFPSGETHLFADHLWSLEQTVTGEYLLEGKPWRENLREVGDWLPDPTTLLILDPSAIPETDSK